MWFAPGAALDALGPTLRRQARRGVLTLDPARAAAWLAHAPQTRAQAQAVLRALDVLPTDGRPLSQGADLAAMWQQREPLYRQFSDFAADNTTPEAAAEAILQQLEQGSP